jgi:hypothetical protein
VCIFSNLNKRVIQNSHTNFVITIFNPTFKLTLFIKVLVLMNKIVQIHEHELYFCQIFHSSLKFFMLHILIVIIDNCKEVQHLTVTVVCVCVVVCDYSIVNWY